MFYSGLYCFLIVLLGVLYKLTLMLGHYLFYDFHPLRSCGVVATWDFRDWMLFTFVAGTVLLMIGLCFYDENKGSRLEG